MPDSFTASLNLTQPEIGGSADSWGTKLNADLGLLDAVFLATGLGTSIGLHVGTGKVANIEGQLQIADSTDTTKRCTFSTTVPTATTINLAIPTTGGTIATVEVATAMVSAAHPAGTILQGYYGLTPPSGYIFADGRTIGDATSLATNRANADCERLFLLFWALGFSVVSGRGATAAADWAAHKQLTLPNHSGRTMAGRDNLSGTAAGVLTGYTAVGTVGGVQTESTTVSGSLAGGTTGSLSVAASGTTSGQIEAPFGAVGGGGGSVATTGHTHNWGGTFSCTGSLGLSGSLSGGVTASVTNIQPTIAVDVIVAL